MNICSVCYKILSIKANEKNQKKRLMLNTESFQHVEKFGSRKK